MKGRWIIISLGLFVALLSSKVNACSCAWAGDFCESIKAFEPERHSVFTLRVFHKYSFEISTDHHVPTIDIVVIEHLAGLGVPFDTISFMGQDGLNCAADVSQVEVGDTLLVSIWNLADTAWNSERPNATYHLFELPNCGTHHLFKRDDKLIEPSRSGAEAPDTFDLVSFMNNFEQCSTLPLLSTSIREEFISRINIVPNPNAGTFYIKSERMAAQYDYSILNLSGQLLTHGTLSSLGNTQIILGNADPGIYLLVVRDGGKMTVRRMVIQ